MKPPRELGTVKWFDAIHKGWGFIVRDNGEPDAWVFHRNVVGEPGEAGWLAAGQRVEFHVRQTPKGPRAKRVVKLRPAGPNTVIVAITENASSDVRNEENRGI